MNLAMPMSRSRCRRIDQARMNTDEHGFGGASVPASRCGIQFNAKDFEPWRHIFVLLEKIAPLGAQGGRLSGWLIITFGLFNLMQNHWH